MGYDFSNEEAQSEFRSFGPVPAGSIVIARMNILNPYSAESAAPDNPLISVSKTGLRQLYCEFTVTEGSYREVRWRQNITLPAGMQNISLTDGQQTSCRIGGAMLKAILQANSKPLNVSQLAVFNGLAFPVKVKINNLSRVSKSGAEYWVNEIAQVITPDRPEYSEMKQKREIINPEGAVKADGGRGRASGNRNWENPPSEDMPAAYYDEVPF